MKKLSFRGLIGLVASSPWPLAQRHWADGQPFIDAAKYVLGILTGGLARTVAVIVVCVLGYMLLSGRIEFPPGDHTHCRDHPDLRLGVSGDRVDRERGMTSIVFKGLLRPPMQFGVPVMFSHWS